MKDSEINLSNTIIDYKMKDNCIEIKTGDNQNITLEKTDNYVNLLNNIITTQEQYKNIKRKEEILNNESFNKKERILMSCISLISIFLLIIFKNIITSLLVLISIILLSTSVITHIYNKLELKKIKNYNKIKESLENNVYMRYTLKNQKSDIETIDEDNIEIDETLYLDDEI